MGFKKAAKYDVIRFPFYHKNIAPNP